MKVESLAEQLLFTTVRIEATTKDGRETVATGFVMAHEVAEREYIHYLVTNRHVFQDAVRARFTFVLEKGNQPVLGETTVIEATDIGRVWAGHPKASVDIAIVPIGSLVSQLRDHGRPPFYRWLSTKTVPTKEALTALDAMEEVVFIGYPTGIWDDHNGLPIVRRGITATPPAVDFRGEECFLIDASIFPGSSGSPVLIVNKGSWVDKRGKVTAGDRVVFLGVLSGAYYRTDEADVLEERPPRNAKRRVALVQQMVDLGQVHRSSLVLETILGHLESKRLAP